MGFERGALSAVWKAGVMMVSGNQGGFSARQMRHCLLLACLSATGLFLTACQREPELMVPERQQVLAALKGAERALALAEARSDVIFNFAQGGRFTGRRFEPRLVEEIVRHQGKHKLLALEYELWSMRHRNLPTLQRKAMNVDPLYDFPSSEAPQEQIIARVLAIMAAALSCSAAIGLSELVGEPGYGYVSTHQLLGMLIATERGCINREDLQEAADPYVRRVYSELMQGLDDFSDVQVERAAFLALAGRVDLVPPSFLYELIIRQSDDGLWRFGVPPDHTTSLAYLLLSIAYGQQAEARSPGVAL